MSQRKAKNMRQSLRDAKTESYSAADMHEANAVLALVPELLGWCRGKGLKPEQAIVLLQAALVNLVQNTTNAATPLACAEALDLTFRNLLGLDEVAS